MKFTVFLLLFFTLVPGTSFLSLSFLGAKSSENSTTENETFNKTANSDESKNSTASAFDDIDNAENINWNWLSVFMNGMNTNSRDLDAERKRIRSTTHRNKRSPGMSDSDKCCVTWVPQSFLCSDRRSEMQSLYKCAIRIIELEFFTKTPLTPLPYLILIRTILYENLIQTF